MAGRSRTSDGDTLGVVSWKEVYYFRSRRETKAERFQATGR